MLTLEQVKLLESKVESLIEMVKSLCTERDELKATIQKQEDRIGYLNGKVSTYEAEQEKIEERVVNALNQLDVFQSSVVHAKAILSQSASSLKDSTVDAGNLSASNESNTDGAGAEGESTSTESGDENQQQVSGEPTAKLENNSEMHTNTTDNSDKQMDIF